MNVNMWDHTATQENLAMLRARGVHVVEPDDGYLACGMTGAGRLAGVETIASKVCEVLGIRHDFSHETVLVTAGPTCEDLDPIRFLTNRSSGKMGYAIAEAALRRGARVILVSGPVSLAPPAEAEFVSVRTAEEMHRAVQERAHAATVIIAAAAVADYRPVMRQETKIKRGPERLTLELEPTPDILAGVARQGGDRIVVGFAAETDHVAEHARDKLARKNLDLVVANDVTQEGAGFDVDTNVVTLYVRDGKEVALPRMKKLQVAQRILDEVLRLRQAAHVPLVASGSNKNRSGAL
jgi:phosphopantothenoylcysteine decarboxylase/phosphopantothenate--cysteine ligase